MPKLSDGVSQSSVDTGGDAVASVIRFVRRFHKALFWFVLLLLAGLIIVAYAPALGAPAMVLAGLVAVVVAATKKIEHLDLGKRLAWALVLVILVGGTLNTGGTSATRQEEERSLAALRDSDPAAYLVKIKKARGDEAWFAELAALDPEAHAKEEARREAEQTKLAEEQAARDARKRQHAAARARLVSQADAYQMCKRAVQSRVKFPSKSDYALFSVRHWGCEGKTCIAGNVELMNGFGNMVPHRYYCEMTKSGVTQVGFEPGAW